MVLSSLLFVGFFMSGDFTARLCYVCYCGLSFSSALDVLEHLSSWDRSVDCPKRIINYGVVLV